jgi:hypothetical protein
VALWCSTARTGFGFGRSHAGQHAPEDPVAASWPLFARRTGSGSVTARRGVQTMTLASAWAVISPCRKGTVAAGSMSDSCGPGFPPRGSLFPADTLRRLFSGFGQRQPTLDVQGRAPDAELPGPEAKKR